MRALVWVVTALMALWSGYWFVGKGAVERAAIALFDRAPEQGLVAENAGLSVQGFPNRFDLTITSPRLGDPQTGIEWEAPFVQVLSLSYKPWHIIAAFAPEQTLRLRLQQVVLTSSKLQASVVVTPNTSLPLDRTTLIGSALGATSSAGWTIAADEVRFATRLDPSLANAHQIGLEIKGLSPDASLMALLPDQPARIDMLRLDATASLSAPLDRFAAQNRPVLTALTVTEGVLQWGDLGIFAKGDLAITNGLPEGRIDIRVEGWRGLVPMAVALGAVTPEVAPTVEGMLEALAATSKTPGALELPLIFKGGRMSLGPLPLGPAPRLN